MLRNGRAPPERKTNRSGEKMNAKRKFFLNGLLLSAVGLAMRGSQLMLGALVARALGAEGVGVNTLIMTVYSFALTLATSGITLTVTRLVAEAVGQGREHTSGALIRGAFLYAIFFGSLSGGLLLLLARPLGLGVISSPISVRALAVLSLSLIPSAVSAVVAGYFTAVRRVTLNAVTTVASQLLRIGLTLVFVTQGGGIDPILGISLGLTLSELAAALIALPELLVDRYIASRRLRGGSPADPHSSATHGQKHTAVPSRKSPARRICERAAVRPIAKMALPLAISAYLRSALLTLEHNLIPRRLERHGQSRADALADYGYLHGMALPLILYPMTPLSSFSGLLVPEFAEAKGAGRTSKMRNLATRALNTTLGYAVGVAVILFLFSSPLGNVVYASSEAGRFIAVLAPVIPIMYLDHVADSILKGIGEHVYSMWVNIADAVLSVALVFFLLPRMGIVGYAAVILGMEAFNFTLSIVRLRSRIAFRIEPVTSAILPLLAALAATALTARLSLARPKTAAGLTLALLLATALFFLVLFILRRIFTLATAQIKKGSAPS